MSRHAPSLLSNYIDEMSRFKIGVADLVKEEYHTTLLHNYLNLSRLMVYAQSIEHSKLSRISRKLKRDIHDEQNKPSFNKSAPNK